MTNSMNKLSTITCAALIPLMLSVMPVTAQQAEGQTEVISRAVQQQTEAAVAGIDLQTRELSLRLDSGFVVTVYVPESVIKLDDINVGDRVIGRFSTSVEAELRAPSKEELAEPWKVVEEGAVSGKGEDVSVEKTRLVRAVVTIVAINKAQGIIFVTDSRGNTHFIGGVEPEKLATLTDGQQAVIVFEESMALTLQKK